jgi:hypothetical protein
MRSKRRALAFRIESAEHCENNHIDKRKAGRSGVNKKKTFPPTFYFRNVNCAKYETKNSFFVKIKLKIIKF